MLEPILGGIESDVHWAYDLGFEPCPEDAPSIFGHQELRGLLRVGADQLSDRPREVGEERVAVLGATALEEPAAPSFSVAPSFSWGWLTRETQHKPTMSLFLCFCFLGGGSPLQIDVPPQAITFRSPFLGNPLGFIWHQGESGCYISGSAGSDSTRVQCADAPRGSMKKSHSGGCGSTDVA